MNLLTISTYMPNVNSVTMKNKAENHSKIPHSINELRHVNSLIKDTFLIKKSIYVGGGEGGQNKIYFILSTDLP